MGSSPLRRPAGESMVKCCQMSSANTIGSHHQAVGCCSDRSQVLPLQREADKHLRRAAMLLQLGAQRCDQALQESTRSSQECKGQILDAEVHTLETTFRAQQNPHSLSQQALGRLIAGYYCASQEADAHEHGSMFLIVCRPGGKTMWQLTWMPSMWATSRVGGWALAGTARR